uniref:Uncharacterized protein n=1 Tax=Rhizophora mucronata TaxID=61149 RepID=A0A2P2N7R9_RHIMU
MLVVKVHAALTSHCVLNVMITVIFHFKNF